MGHEDPKEKLVRERGWFVPSLHGRYINEEVNGLEMGKNKAGANDPCPCGSGKRYKDCCMKHGM